MPIRINLLAEAQAAEEDRRKDPVKRAYYAGGFIVFLVVLWGATLQLKIIAASSDMGTLQSQWNSLEEPYKEVVTKQRQHLEAEEKLAALERLRTNRFLWATALNALQQSLNGIDNVELVRLRTEQSFVPGERSGPTPSGAAQPVKVPTATERKSIVLEAIDHSPQPGTQVNRYKQALANIPFFRDTLQKTNGVLLTSLSAPQAGSGGGAFVKFSLQCSFPEEVR